MVFLVFLVSLAATILFVMLLAKPIQKFPFIFYNIATVLALLLAILPVTSFTQIHKRMKPEVWKNVQRFSYLFYGLIYIHVLCIMLPSVIAGYSTITVNIVIYSVLFASYLLLRTAKYAMKRRVQPASAAFQ